MKLKHIYSFLLFYFIANIGFAQTVDFDELSYKGLRFYSAKADIIQKLGTPKKVYDPTYDCGFLSADTQGQTYTTLDYGAFKFTGNQKEHYLLEIVDFEKDLSVIVTYKNQNLSHNTTLSELVEIFGQELAQTFGKRKDGTIILFQKNSDDGLRLYLKNGKLIRLEYWSPC
ncbi:hypothetical protein [uncultured Kordia sp.]|uniref:hypothetical protein n=1 Tax=uncultured Kordia sp. TaxID=507699 RepID=UPI00260D66DE|nr:hypothetical protein [uncultured Kordia sp.]